MVPLEGKTSYTLFEVLEDWENQLKHADFSKTFQNGEMLGTMKRSARTLIPLIEFSSKLNLTESILWGHTNVR
jgi:hypothetical protein